MSVEELKKEVKAVSFEESLERNAVIVVMIIIGFVLTGMPINLSVILAILITVYINHVKNKK
jgi:hypothetical protein